MSLRLVVALLVVLAIGLVSARPALRALGHWLVLEKADFETVDAIVLVEGGVPDRPLKARDLFNQKKSSRIVLVREQRPSYLKELDELGIHVPGYCELNQLVLTKVGVPAASIEEAPGDARSTWEEAVAFSDYGVAHGIKSAVVVTSNFHTRRAYMNFERACKPKGITVYVVPAEASEFDPSAWWTRRDQLKVFYMEAAKLTAYYLGFR